MRTYKVSTPAAGHTGEVGGIHFVQGVAVVEAPAPLPSMRSSDDEAFTRAQLAEREEIGQHPGYRAMAYFRQAGYDIEDITDEHGPEADDKTAGKSTPAKAAGTKDGAK